MTRDEKSALRGEIARELEDILTYWAENCHDRERGGYLTVNRAGRVTSRGGEKGAVLNARCLWTFAAAYRLTGDERWRREAEEQYRYLRDHYLDREYGWVYSSLDGDGNVTDDRKDTYNGTFTLFAFTEYHLATGDRESLAEAIELYRTLEARARDRVNGGYIDTFGRDWSPEPVTKSLRAHLHVLECYTNLYTIWPDEGLKRAIDDVLRSLTSDMLRRDTGAMKQWFSADWVPTDDEDSYGDDIEGSWLFYECAGISGEGAPHEAVDETAHILMDHVLREGYDAVNGGVWSKFHHGEKHREKSWWMQCEALNAFLLWYGRTGEEKYLDLFRRTWGFTAAAFGSHSGAWPANAAETGEDLDPDRIAMCPYHNARTCMRAIRALDALGS